MTMHTATRITCPKCNGIGELNDDHGITIGCSSCLSSGFVYETTDRGESNRYQRHPLKPTGSSFFTPSVGDFKVSRTPSVVNFGIADWQTRRASR